MFYREKKGGKKRGKKREGERAGWLRRSDNSIPTVIESQTDILYKQANLGHV